jgi:16S rRNA (uracil1498-N3)-methyltransferase
MPGGPRFHCPAPLHSGMTLELPPAAARHAQVLRLQPGSSITLFGHLGTAPAGGEFAATVTAMGRQSVQVRVGAHDPVERELPRRLHLAIGIPANERMDWLVEKATELGAASIQPLMTERSVVRLDAQRGQKKLAHWQSIVAAACEQCGRNQLTQVATPLTLAQWLGLRASGPAAPGQAALTLSLQPGSVPLAQWRAHAAHSTTDIVFLCGPEGGLSSAEEAQAVAAGHAAVSLGARTLRAETAALAALTLLG